MATQYAFGQIVRDGLVLSLDAADLNSFNGSSSTTWKDLTENQNTLVLYNGSTYSTNGKGSIVFDGVNDGVSGSNASVYSITNTITLEAWAYITTSTGFIIGKGPSNGVGTSFPGNYELQINASNQLSFLYQVNNTAANSAFEVYATTTNVFSSNTWTHIVASASTLGTAGTRIITIYTNGIARTTTRGGTAGDIVSTNNTEPLKIGRRTDGTVMGGNIAIVRMYNRALSADEAIQNYNAQKSRFGL
jgi:hypothetical protein